jgi:hypothetical protein
VSVGVDDVRRARSGYAGERERGFVKYRDAFKP